MSGLFHLLNFFSVQFMVKAPFINDVTNFDPKLTPRPPSVTLKWEFYLHLHTYPLPPTFLFGETFTVFHGVQETHFRKKHIFDDMKCNNCCFFLICFWTVVSFFTQLYVSRPLFHFSPKIWQRIDLNLRPPNLIYDELDHRTMVSCL